jgi:hypothetical protein
MIIRVFSCLAKSRPISYWILLTSAAAPLWACTSRSLEKPPIDVTQTDEVSFQVTENREIDLLFMVDNSSSMSLAQTNLINNFPTFIQVLSQIPDQNLVPRLPNVHVGVITSDLGIGAEGDQGLVDTCTGTGQGGILQNSAGPPPVVQCNPNFTNATARWIEDDGMGTTNYSGPLAATFSCIATTGAAGCGLERQIQSVERALGVEGLAAAKRANANAQAQPPAENVGFIRDGAFLGIIMITNEDDNYSTKPGQDYLYDVNPPNDGQGGPLGPPGNYRGNHWTDLCDGPEGMGVMPRLDSPTGGTGTALETYTNCRSNENSPYGISVDDAAANIKALKEDPSQILVAAITGPPAPYVVDWRPPNKSGDPPWPYIEHSCGTDGGLFADPAVRMTQFVNDFGKNGLIESFCDNDYGPALSLIANALITLIPPPCVVGTLWMDRGGNPACTVTDHTPDGAGGTVDQVLPSCVGNGNTAPCYSMAADNATCGANGYKISFTRNGTVPDNLRTSVACRTCPAGINTNGLVEPGCS